MGFQKTSGQRTNQVTHHWAQNRAPIGTPGYRDGPELLCRTLSVGGGLSQLIFWGIKVQNSYRHPGLQKKDFYKIKESEPQGVQIPEGKHLDSSPPASSPLQDSFKWPEVN